MQQGKFSLTHFIPGILIAGLLVVAPGGFAQAKVSTVPDAQVESNVLKALAGAPELADQPIKSTTVYGTVTLTGTVKDEASRDLAEKLVSHAEGVQKVIDELAIGAVAAPQAADSQTAGEPPQSPDGSAEPPPQDEQAPDAANSSVAPPAVAPPQAAQPYPPPPPQAGNYPPGYQQPYSQPYHPYVAQRGGDTVVVPSGAFLQVRIDQGMDSKHTAPDTVFNGQVLNDVVANGFIAIPRGAFIEGRVVDSRSAGQLKGRGILALQLTQVTMGGRTYPIITSVWSQQGASKTANTVGNTVGLGAVGALIGAVAGGGAGAAIGAGVGGVAGLGVSSASHAGEAGIPPEAILNFNLAQPVQLTTLSQAELYRMGSGLQRRYYPPPPPPPPQYYYRPY
jgi:hypothetical protein